MGLKEANEQAQAATEQYRRWYSLYPHLLFQPADTIAMILVDMARPNPMGVMEKLYLDRATAAAVQALAASLAYRKTHGKFPDTLEQAMMAAGLPVPIDVATGKPIGYRLERDRPMVWLAGLDQQDSGGKKAYNRNMSERVEGMDIVYRWGETPEVFKKKATP